MPRPIIDTQSSRPRYIRRRAIQGAILVAVLIVILIGVYYVLEHPGGPVTHGALAPVSAGIQETAPAVAESGAFYSRRSHAA
jgi:hypothetical protein